MFAGVRALSSAHVASRSKSISIIIETAWFYFAFRESFERTCPTSRKIAKQTVRARMASWLKRVASDAPAEHSEHPPVESALQRLLAKRKAEASPAVSPEKGDRPADASLASELADRLALDEAKGEAALLVVLIVLLLLGQCLLNTRWLAR